MWVKQVHKPSPSQHHLSIAAINLLTIPSLGPGVMIFHWTFTHSHMGLTQGFTQGNSAGCLSPKSMGNPWEIHDEKLMGYSKQVPFFAIRMSDSFLSSIPEIFRTF